MAIQFKILTALLGLFLLTGAFTASAQEIDYTESSEEMILEGSDEEVSEDEEATNSSEAVDSSEDY